MVFLFHNGATGGKNLQSSTLFKRRALPQASVVHLGVFMGIFYYILFVVGFFLLTVACGQKGPYSSMSVNTAYGEETISSSCPAWNDGCTIYCRTNTSTHFMEYATKDKCNEEDISRSRCENNNYKTALPEGWSRAQTKDKCI